MNRKINDFLEEISDNFSKLFVETFLLRYSNEFGKKDLLKNMELTKGKIIEKIDKECINVSKCFKNNIK